MPRASGADGEAGIAPACFDARTLIPNTPRRMLDEFGRGASSPLPQVGGGTLAVLHMEEMPEGYQHAFAKVIDTDPGPGSRRQRISGEAILPPDARVILIEPSGDMTYTDIRRVCAFFWLGHYEDDL